MSRLAFAAAALFALSTAASAATLGTNLITNPGAETGDMTGWLTDGVSVATETGGAPFEVNSGTYAFTGALGSSAEFMQQNIDLSALATLIDAGAVSFEFEAALQDRTAGGSNDDVVAQVFFFDAGQVNGTGQSAVLADPTNGVNVFTYDIVGDSGAVPIGTRFATVVLNFTRQAGASTDAFADDLSLVLSAAPVPVPAGLPLLAGGLGALAWLRRRKS
jgi:hypothetical protein